MLGGKKSSSEWWLALYIRPDAESSEATEDSSQDQSTWPHESEATSDQRLGQTLRTIQIWTSMRHGRGPRRSLTFPKHHANAETPPTAHFSIVCIRLRNLLLGTWLDVPALADARLLTSTLA